MPHRVNNRSFSPTLNFAMGKQLTTISDLRLYKNERGGK